jgi:trehalose 6-phosphate phosphatase
MQAPSQPFLPPPFNLRQTALFLDFDGTLTELAPQPDAVKLPADLLPLLSQLCLQLNGALALVSGRRLTDLDAFLAPLQLPTAAEHGAQRRLSNGQHSSILPPDFRAVLRVARALVQRHPGLQLEVKTTALALHYRQAPALEALCQQHLCEAVLRTPGVELLQGKCVLEVKAAGVSKGDAMAAFMAESPFAGRTPLFAGDDRTDEDGFAWVRSVGGHGLKVGEGPTLARHRCANPQALRQWLSAQLAPGLRGRV